MSFFSPHRTSDDAYYCRWVFNALNYIKVVVTLQSLTPRLCFIIMIQIKIWWTFVKFCSNLSLYKQKTCCAKWNRTFEILPKTRVYGRVWSVSLDYTRLLPHCGPIRKFTSQFTTCMWGPGGGLQGSIQLLGLCPQQSLIKSWEMKEIKRSSHPDRWWQINMAAGQKWWKDNLRITYVAIIKLLFFYPAPKAVPIMLELIDTLIFMACLIPGFGTNPASLWNDGMIELWRKLWNLNFQKLMRNLTCRCCLTAQLWCIFWAYYIYF